MDNSRSNPLPGEGESPPLVSLRILSPSFESNENISLENLPLSTTVHDVKTHLTQLVPSRPAPEQQRLIYRGKPLLNPKATLKGFLEPPLDCVHTMHLVLPPAPEALTNNGIAAHDSSLRFRGTSGQSPSLNAQRLNGDRREQAVLATGAQPSQETGHAPLPPATNQHITRLQETLNRIEQIQPQTEALNQIAERARDVLNAHALRMRFLNTNNPLNADGSSQMPQHNQLSQYNHLPHQPRTHSAPATNPSGSTAASVNIPQPWNNEAPQNLLLARIATQIIGLELEIQRGNAPPLDAIIRVRASLYAMLDSRYRQPNLAISSEAEGLLLRLQHVYTRAYQIRQVEYMRRIPPPAASYPGGPTQAATTTGLYMVTAPNGEQMIISAPNQPQTLSPNVPSFPLFPDTPQPPVNEAGTAAAAVDGAMQNAVRQAVLNQREADAGGGNGNRNANRNGNDNDHLAHNIRRFWLFLRLYFFCFLFTDTGTWEHFLFVFVAFLISFFSESPILRRAFEVVVEPVQRHLEGLIHGQLPAPPQQNGNANANTDTNANNNTVNNNNGVPQQRPAVAGGPDHGLRRIERAFALFIASLIPGVGERQVEVRNAAQEAARNAQQQQNREAEERAAGDRDDEAHPNNAN